MYLYLFHPRRTGGGSRGVRIPIGDILSSGIGTPSGQMRAICMRKLRRVTKFYGLYRTLIPLSQARKCRKIIYAKSAKCLRNICETLRNGAKQMVRRLRNLAKWLRNACETLRNSRETPAKLPRNLAKLPRNGRETLRNGCNNTTSSFGRDIILDELLPQGVVHIL